LGNVEGIISMTVSTLNSGCHLVILFLSITIGGINVFKYFWKQKILVVSN